MEKFAIVGLACLFPGADTPETFWQNLIAGRSTTTLATAEQFGHDPALYYDPNQDNLDSTYFVRGGFVQRRPGRQSVVEWTQYVVHTALADGGYLGRADALARCGLMLGNLSFPTLDSNHLFQPLYQHILGSAIGLLAGTSLRLSFPPSDAGSAAEHAAAPAYPVTVAAHHFGLGGPRFALDAACASSLYAVALACEYLAAGKADLMLAGAVSAADPLFVNLGFAHLGAYPAGSKSSRPLDASSDGLISSEGAGMFLLKRAADARRDGDRIYALVSGVGLANDGRGKHVLTPNVKGQVMALERAYAAAGLRPSAVTYVECHASGTPVGDRTELNSMEQHFGAAAPPKIGSVKANVGHLLTAAGMASMLKVILAMQHGQIPATPGVVQPLTSQGGVFDGGQIVTQNIPWDGGAFGVNAFGFGGVSAHLILEQPQFAARLPQNRQDTYNLTQQTAAVPGPMAIIGMDAHFGPLENLDAYARAMYAAAPAFGPVPEHRWKGLHKHPQLLRRFGLEAVPQGAYIGAFEMDFMHFKIPPNPADEPIMQQLLLLKVADNAIRDARLREGANVAVVVAMSTELALHQLRGRVDLNWQIEQALAEAGLPLGPDESAELKRIAKDALLNPAQANHYVSYIGNITASRVSSLWDFSGPTFTISSEENSVFRALEVAQMLLAKGEVEAVVVGAVDMAGSLESVLLRNQLGPIATTAAVGFARESDGWLVGEGAGAVVLTQANSAAQADAYAVIDSLAFAPDVAQAAHNALQQAGAAPADIGYVEFHASGLPNEDAAEIAGLTAVYRGGEATTAIGSAKAIIGHTFAASGIAGLIRTALALAGRFIPALPHWNAPKSAEAWAGSTFWAAAQSRTWYDHVRKAGVSSLGADGLAAHVVLSSGMRGHDAAHLPFGAPYLFLISGDDLAGLHRRLDQLATAAPTPLHTLAAACFADYRPAAYTLALVAKNEKDLPQEIERARYGLRDALANGGDWSTPAGSYFTARPVGTQGHAAFVYPGAFNSYPKLGYDLLHYFPAVYDALRAVKADVGGAVHERLLYPRSLEKPGPKLTAQMKNALAANAVAMVESGLSFAVLYTRIMADYFKIHPRAAFGYSLGEGSMMWGLGVWRDGDAGSAALHASPLFKTRLAGPMDAVREAWGIAPEVPPEQFWAAYFIAAPVEMVRAAVANQSKVYLTHINTPREVMIAGDPAACLRVVEVVAAQKGESMKAPFDVVIHNEAMLGEYSAFYALHDLPVYAPAAQSEVTFYSAADYAPLRLERRAVAGAISRMACKPIDFPRLVERAYADGARVFLELGPRSTCARWIDETLGDRPHIAVSVDNLGADDRTSLVKMMARLLSHHVPLDAAPLFAPLPAPAPLNGKKSLVRTVRPGGQDIYAAIVNEENRRRLGLTGAAAFQPMPTPASSAGSLPTPAMTPVHSAHIAFLQARRQGLQQLGQIIALGAANPAPSTPPQPVIIPAAPVLHIPPPNPAPSPTVAAGRAPQYPFEKINQFAIGRVANCYGERYTIYDDRRAPRIPNGDLLLVSRAVEISGERFKSAPGTRIHAEYDVPVDAWFYRDNPYPTMPYSVYMEIALQPCGFLSAYHGPTLDFPDIDFYFRNLDGYGTLHHDRDMRGRTITNLVTLLSSTIMQGIIIQKFSFAMYDGDLLFYDGEATFGYFTKEALISQAGLDQGKLVPRWIDTLADDPAASLAPGAIVAINPRQPYGSDFLRLAGGQLAFTDAIRVVPGGGRFNQGYAYANTIIDPTAWFFKCHFFQDPVMPGSIGVETILQAMQAYVIETGLASDLKTPHFAQADAGHRTTWRYRGQILSDSEKSHVEANIKRIERQAGRMVLYADASLWRDKLRIYEVKDIALAVVEGA